MFFARGTSSCSRSTIIGREPWSIAASVAFARRLSSVAATTRSTATSSSSGVSLDGTLTEIHPEIATTIDGPASGEGCAAQVAERPQLLVTNLMVASAMLNCLWAVCEQGSAPYSEVFLDIVQNAARPRRRFRVDVDAA